MNLKKKLLAMPFVTMTLIPFLMQFALAVEETTEASGGIGATIAEKGFIGFLLAGGWIFIVTGIGHVITIVAPILGVKKVADKKKAKKNAAENAGATAEENTETPVETVETGDAAAESEITETAVPAESVEE